MPVPELSAPADTPPAPADTPPSSSGEPELVLATSGLRKRFGSFAAVDGIDLRVRRGEIYGFLGRNGAGKTTTIRMLMGIIAPTSGQMTIFGRRRRRPRIREKREIGYVSQEQHFYPWMTCAGIGRFTGGFYPNWDAAEFARLLELLELPPKRRISRLSGGMRVKLALALALAHRPQLLILDEPTSSLDAVARREFLDIIQSESQLARCTTFFSSHRIDEVERVADRIGLIHEGKLQYQGTVSALKESVRQVLVRNDPSAAFAPAAPPPAPAETKPGAPASAAESVPPFPIAAAPRPEPPPAPASTPKPADSEGEPPPLPAGPPLPPLDLPEGFRLLRDEPALGGRLLVLQADPARWALAPASWAQLAPLPLEEIFIALAGKARLSTPES